MTGLWQAHRDPDADLAPCQRCGKDVVLQYDPPCPHGWVACPECGHPAVCAVCAVEAVRERWADPFLVGEPEADPWGPLAAESRADVARFWAVRGDRPTKPEGESA